MVSVYGGKRSYSPGICLRVTEKDHKEHRSGYLVFRSRFKRNISQIQNQSIAVTATCFVFVSFFRTMLKAEAWPLKNGSNKLDAGPKSEKDLGQLSDR
jgi:hypothetical protein